MEIFEYGPQLEVWKDVVGYETLYLVSNYGLIKSCNNKRLLKCSPDTRGYLTVSPYLDGKKTTKSAHVIVACAFLGHKPNGTHDVVVDHKNNIKTDNFYLNLQLTTQRHNATKNRNPESNLSGVYFNKSHNNNKWYSKIKFKGKNISLGAYPSKELASEAYQTARSRIDNGENLFDVYSRKGVGSVFMHKKTKKWEARYKHKYIGTYLSEESAREGLSDYLLKKTT